MKQKVLLDSLPTLTIFTAKPDVHYHVHDIFLFFFVALCRIIFIKHSMEVKQGGFKFRTVQGILDVSIRIACVTIHHLTPAGVAGIDGSF